MDFKTLLHLSSLAKGEEKDCDDFPSDCFLKCEPQINLFLGAPKSGKTFCLKSLIYNFQKLNYFKFGIVYCRTTFNHAYDFMPEKYVFDDYSEKNLQDYIGKLKNYMTTTGKKPEPSFIIFDDLLGLIDMYSPFFTNLVTTYRHYNLSIFLTSQYINRGTSTVLRECVSNAFMFRTVMKNSLKGLYDAFGQIYFENYDEFKDKLTEITTQKYHCLVYCSNQLTPEDTYFDYIAKEVPPFKIKFYEKEEKKKVSFAAIV